MNIDKGGLVLEEYKVWPAVGAGSLLVFVIWGGDVVRLFLQLLENQSNADRLAATAFPALLGFVFAAILQAKYWLGFVWLAVVSAHLSIIMSIFDLAAAYVDIFITLLPLVIMFAVQGGALYAKRRWQLKGVGADG